MAGLVPLTEQTQKARPSPRQSLLYLLAEDPTRVDAHAKDEHTNDEFHH
jgi:hypothetical protein